MAQLAIMAALCCFRIMPLWRCSCFLAALSFFNESLSRLGSTIALLLRHNPFLGWPGLEDASPNPRGILRSARSSPGHPTQISDDVEALPSNPMYEARHSNIPRAADRQCFMNTYLFPADKDATAALADIEADVWKTLSKAADDSMAAWRLPCLATQSCNGSHRNGCLPVTYCSSGSKSSRSGLILSGSISSTIAYLPSHQR